jgi:hypothetical protein
LQSALVDINDIRHRYQSTFKNVHRWLLDYYNYYILCYVGI